MIVASAFVIAVIGAVAWPLLRFIIGSIDQLDLAIHVSVAALTLLMALGVVAVGPLARLMPALSSRWLSLAAAAGLSWFIFENAWRLGMSKWALIFVALLFAAHALDGFKLLTLAAVLFAAATTAADLWPPAPVPAAAAPPRHTSARYHQIRDPAALNIVWIIIDAVRADHVTSLGYRRATTPHFDAFAAESLSFTRAYSQSSATLFSVSSMLIGTNPAEMEWDMVGLRPQPSRRFRTLAERLDEDGYRSLMVVNGYIKRRFSGLQRGYHEVEDAWLDIDRQYWREHGSSASAATQAIGQIERHLARRDAGPFFSTVYFEDPHAPYYRHDGFPEFGNLPIDRYDYDIANADRSLGYLLGYLRGRSRLWERTIVVVTSDHGEEFGEHGGRRHSRTCYRESVHVPLALRVPGLAPRRVDDVVSLVDIVPTLLELIGKPDDDATLSGRSLLIPALEENAAPRPALCSTASQRDEPFFVRSVRLDRATLIEDQLRGTVELYDDAAEKNDNAHDPARAAQISALRGWLEATRVGTLRDHTRY